MLRARTLTLIALSASLAAGCAYISDEDEKWRLDPDGDDVPIGEDCDDTNGDLAQEVTWFTDADGDGFGAPGSEQTGCEAPAGSADNGDDCDDSDNTVFPEAPDEWYDGVDSNCLGDDDYDQDGDGYTNDVDCDDEDPARAPDDSVAEIYFNGVDDNCDNTDQDGDQDGDGFWAEDYVARVDAAGATPLPIPDGAAGDCWDDASSVPAEQEVVDGFPDLTAADVNPGAAETWYDSADQDCGGYDDNEDGVPDDFDQDSDSHASLTHPNRAGETGDDCDDTDAGVNPSATETWYDGVDADCGGEDDYDADGDLYQSADHGGDDCDDVDAAVNPGAFDFWYDGVDQDCGGEDDYDADGDGDQSADWGGFDCDDGDDTISSLATEVWYDGVDTDCDGGSDYDADGDGYDSSAETTAGQDCDDANASANPGMTEICDNGFDDDCDGSGDTSAGVCWLEGDISVTAADAILTGSASSDQVGGTVAVGGDLDGDGAGDWAVAAYRDSTTGASSAGAVYVGDVPSSGTSSLHDLPIAIRGDAASDNFGRSVAIGDFDGDGNDDLYAGASGVDTSASGGGAAYLFLGPLPSGRSSASSYDAAVFGGTSSGGLGYGITTLGDQDGDGTDEIAIVSSSGWITVAVGHTAGSTLDSDQERITPVSTGDNFGYDLDGTGDVDGDGIDDLLVGAPTASDGGASSSGTAYLFHGPITADMAAGDAVAFTGAATTDYVGYSVSLGGDVNDDGFDDVLVGGTGSNTPGSTFDGGAFLLHGPATTSGSIGTVADASLGAPTSGYCGRSVSAEGDIDGDGDADILVGCEYENGAFSQAGSAYLVYDAPSGAVDLGVLAMARFQGGQTYEYFARVYAVPDVDGDGYDEVLVGGTSYDGTASNAGRLGLFLGGSW